MKEKLYFIFFFTLLSGLSLRAQIFSAEGLNMPGSWNGFTNPPTNSVFRMANPPGTSIEVPCGTDLSGGSINLYNNLNPANPLATSIYRASFSTADAGGTGNYNFLFTSGPCTNFFQNKWSKSNTPFTGVNVSFNTVETYYYCNTSGAGNPAGCVDWGNTDILLTTGKYYTANFIDNGYSNTTGIFFETSALPKSITSVSSSYDNSSGGCNGAAGLIVTVTCSGVPAAEEKFYIRYSTASNFSTSTFTPVVFADTTQPSTGKAVIPFAAGTGVYFYAMSSTLSAAAISPYNTFNNADVVTLSANTNGGSNYFYSFPPGTSASNTLSGNYLIDNSAGIFFPNSFAFSSFASAVSALSANGICNHVTIQVPGNYTETAPAGGYIIQYSSGVPVSNGSKTVTLRKKGAAGSHPLLTAWNNGSGTITAGSASAGDGIFKIVGADYITIDKIDLQENASNSGAGPWMEYGYALLKESAANGSQYCSITNCIITLNRLNNTSPGTTGNEAGSTGIASLNITNASSSNVVISSSTGSNSNNKFTGNQIRNCFNGIVMKGYNASSPYTLYDQNNKAGGTASATGNTIQNYGGSGSVQAYGIYMIYQNGDSVRYNAIDNLANGGSAHPHILYGIFHSTGTNSSVYIGNNTISIAKSNSNNDLVVIRSSLYGTGKVDVVNNTITNCSSAGGSSTFYGIYMASASTRQNITGNFIVNNPSLNCTGSAYLIYTNNSAGTLITVSNNTISAFTKSAAGNTIYGYYNASGSTGGTETISSNTISDIIGTGSTHLYGIYSVAFTVSSQDASITGNNISNLSTNGLASTLLMGIKYEKTNNTKSAMISDNVVESLSGGATITGIYGGVSTGGSYNTSFLNNTIHDITSTNGDIYGIQAANSDLTIGLNTIYGLTTNASKAIRGIYFLGYMDLRCYRNKIYNLTAYGSNAAAYGIYDDNSASDHDVYNNIIGDIKAPESSMANAVSCFISGVNMSPPIRLYNNTFYLNASSTGTNFGSAAVYINTNGFANTTIISKNNIMVNLSTPNGTGISSAFRTTNTNYSTYHTTSNNNLFYAGAPSASHVLFYNGTTGYQTISAFKAAVGPLRESNSDSALPDFLNTSNGAATDYLHIDPSGANVTYVDMQALPINNEMGWYNNVLTIDADFDAQSRDPVTPDVGADEIVPLILPIELTYFHAFMKEYFAELIWNTASEFNSDYFAIERSIDGAEFNEIGSVAAAQFSNLPTSYSFTDYQVKELAVSRIYYRLRMVDLDGSFDYSQIQVLDLNAAPNLPLVFPNPFADAINILWNAPDINAEIQLADAVGRILTSQKMELNEGFSTISFEVLPQLSNGIYFLHIISNNEVVTVKVVKEK